MAINNKRSPFIILMIGLVLSVSQLTACATILLDDYINQGRPRIKSPKEVDNHDLVRTRTMREFYIEKLQHAALDGENSTLQICVLAAYLVPSQSRDSIGFSNYTITVATGSKDYAIKKFSGITKGCNQPEDKNVKLMQVPTHAPEYFLPAPGTVGVDNFLIDPSSFGFKNGYVLLTVDHKALNLGDRFTYFRLNVEDSIISKNKITIEPETETYAVVASSHTPKSEPKPPFHKKNLLYVFIPATFAVDLVTLPLQLILFIIYNLTGVG